MWVPDVYQGAPTPVAAFLSVGEQGRRLRRRPAHLLRGLRAGQLRQRATGRTSSRSRRRLDDRRERLGARADEHQAAARLQLDRAGGQLHDRPWRRSRPPTTARRSAPAASRSSSPPTRSRTSARSSASSPFEQRTGTDEIADYAGLSGERRSWRWPSGSAWSPSPASRRLPASSPSCTSSTRPCRATLSGWLSSGVSTRDLRVLLSARRERDVSMSPAEEERISTGPWLGTAVAASGMGVLVLFIFAAPVIDAAQRAASAIS